MERDELLESLSRRRLRPATVRAVSDVAREAFLPPGLRPRAWEDGALPIGAGQTISQPSLVAHMVDLLDLRPADRVLDVGTGSGYHAAVLARLAAWVFSVERHAELSVQAARALAATGAHNVTLRVGDGTAGWPEEAPFDAINVAAAGEGGVPEALLGQLADGGRLIAPVRDAGDERLVLVRRDGERLHETEHGAVRFVPLVPDG